MPLDELHSIVRIKIDYNLTIKTWNTSILYKHDSNHRSILFHVPAIEDYGV